MTIDDRLVSIDGKQKCIAATRCRSVFAGDGQWREPSRKEQNLERYKW